MSYGFNISLGAALSGFSLLLLPLLASWWCWCVAEHLHSCTASPLVSHFSLNLTLIRVFFKWKCKRLAICFTYGAWVTGCLRGAVHLYYQVASSSGYESADKTTTVLIHRFPLLQVLHLMNKMNLPCPFGPVTVRPPLVSLSTWIFNAGEKYNAIELKLK